MWVEVKAVQMDNDGDGQNTVKDSTQQKQNKNLFQYFMLCETLTFSLRVVLCYLSTASLSFALSSIHNRKKKKTFAFANGISIL